MPRLFIVGGIQRPKATRYLFGLKVVRNREQIMEAFGVWWPSWSSKPVTRIARVVGSIPIRFRLFHSADAHA